MTGAVLTPAMARILNFVGAAALLGVLVGAYIYQFHFRELPCTLCLLQRLAMIGVAFGAVMNLVLGPDPRHYGVCLVSAAFGITVSTRQTLLHINPYFNTETGEPTLEAATNPAFGHAVLGLDLYVWGVVIFATVILTTGIALFFRGQFAPARQDSQWLDRLAAIGVGALFIAAATETVTAFMECGLGDCPNDGSWNWWIFR
ncbi:MAG: disulfide bond formation protein B [Methyloceanibacter sp.]